MNIVRKKYTSKSGAKKALRATCDTILNEEETAGTFGFANFHIEGTALVASSTYHVKSTLAAMLGLTFRDVPTAHLVQIYSGEPNAAKDARGNYDRKKLIQCAKRNGYTPLEALETAEEQWKATE